MHWVRLINSELWRVFNLLIFTPSFSSSLQKGARRGNEQKQVSTSAPPFLLRYLLPRNFSPLRLLRRLFSIAITFAARPYPSRRGSCQRARYGLAVHSREKTELPTQWAPKKNASCLLKFWLLDLFPPPSLFFKATKTATRTPLLETLRLTRKGENRVEIALFSRREKAAFSSSPPLFFAVFNKREGDAEKDAAQWPHSTLLNCSLHRRRRHPLPPTEKRSCERKEFPPPSHSVSRLSIRFWFEPLSSAAVSATIGARRPLLLPCSLLHCRTDRPTMPLFFARGKRKKGMANGGKLLLRMLRYDTRHAPRVSYCMGGHCTVGVCPGIERGREGGRPK